MLTSLDFKFIDLQLNARVSCVIEKPAGSTCIGLLRVSGTI